MTEARYTVLVIDDDRDLLKVLARRLSVEGYCALTAADDYLVKPVNAAELRECLMVCLARHGKPPRSRREASSA